MGSVLIVLQSVRRKKIKLKVLDASGFVYLLFCIFWVLVLVCFLTLF